MKIIYEGKEIEIKDEANGFDLAKEFDAENKNEDVGYLVDEKICDMRMPLPAGKEIKFIKKGSKEAFEMLNHSTSHLMAQALTHLYPGCKFGFGPAIDEGTTEAMHLENETTQPKESVGGAIARVGSSAVTLGASELTIQAGKLLASGAYGKMSYDIPGGKREMWATFNRDTRICRLCSSTITRDCTSVYKHGFIGIGRKNETNCTESEPIEKCDDIQM